MNTFTKQLIGAAIGGACGHFIAMVIIEIIRIKEAPADSGDFPDWLDGTENNPIDEQGNPVPDIDTLKANTKLITENRKEVRRNELKTKNYTQHFVSQGRPDLAALAAKYNGEEPEALLEETETDLVEEAIFEIAKDDDFDAPEEDADAIDPAIISMEEYADDAGAYKHVTLMYYEDDILTDENQNPIDRPENILGEDALVSFGELSQDPDIVYVRNHEKRAMYEVVRTNKNFVVPSVRTRTLRDIRQARNIKKEEDNGEESNA